MSDKTFTMEEIAQMQKIFAGQKDTIWPHGNAGLLRDGTVRPDMASAIPADGSWSTSMIPFIESRYTDQVVEIFTGVTDDEGSNPADTCSTPPHPGNLKTARFSFPYGTFHMGTDKFNFVHGNERANYADMNRRFINPPAINSPLMPETIRANPDSINTIMGKLHFEFGIKTHQNWARPAWQGLSTRTNAQTHLGWISEFNGLEQQIATGKTDLNTGFAATAADSVVVNYNQAIGSNFVLTLSNLIRRVTKDAMLAGMSQTEFHIVIHPTMEFALYDNWACNYNTARCEPDATNGRRMNVETATRLRDAMMTGNYLLVDGRQYPVFMDWGIGHTINMQTGQFTSDVFVVPVSWAGRALTYWEYKSFNGQEINEILGRSTANKYRVINNGLYLCTVTEDRTCIEWQYNAKARMILDYPFLAGRLDNVIVPGNVANQFNDPFVSEFYHENGGTFAR